MKDNVKDSVEAPHASTFWTRTLPQIDHQEAATPEYLETRNGGSGLRSAVGRPEQEKSRYLRATSAASLQNFAELAQNLSS